MARKRFNAEQIVAIHREAERGVALADLVRTHGFFRSYGPKPLSFLDRHPK